MPSANTRRLSAADIEQKPIVCELGGLTSETKWNASMHFHSLGIEMILFIKGGAIIETDGVSYSAEAGDLVIHQPFVKHREYFSPRDDGVACYHVGMLDCKLRGLDEGKILPAGVPPVLNTGVWQPEIEACFRFIHAEGTQQKSGFSQLANNQLQVLLLLVLRLISEGIQHPQSMQADLCQEVTRYIEHNYQNTIKMADLADLFHVSHSHLSHIFKREMGMSLTQYLTAHRMHEAKRLLIMTNLSIKEIASRVGFPNMARFSTQFRQATNTAPREYRMLKRIKGLEKYDTEALSIGEKPITSKRMEHHK